MITDQTTSESWPDFRERIFGSPYWIWHDGIPPSAIDNLKNENQEFLHDKILEGLKHKDYLAVYIIGKLNITKFVHLLQKEIRKAKDKYLIELAVTLNRMDPEHSQQYANDAIIALQDATLQTRMDAAMSLREFSPQLVSEALLKAIELETDHLVRYHATHSFLHIHQLDQAQIPNYNEIFKEATSDDSHDRKLAVKELKALLK